MLNKTDSSIPRALSRRRRVNLTDKNNVKTRKCQIEDAILYKFEMVEINFEYKIKKVTKLLQALAMWLKNSLGQQKQNKSNIRKIDE